MLHIIMGNQMKTDLKFDEIFFTSRNKIEEIMNAVVEKRRIDKDFDHKLLHNPTETLQKEGLELQKGFSIQIVKTKEEAKALPDKIIPLILQNKEGVLSASDLDRVVGGCERYSCRMGFECYD
jgi:hypothetical protein